MNWIPCNQRNLIHLRFTLCVVRMQVKDGRMAEIMGVGQEAIRQNRYRIRRKIAIQEGEMLEEIILSV